MASLIDLHDDFAHDCTFDIMRRSFLFIPGCPCIDDELLAIVALVEDCPEPFRSPDEVLDGFVGILVDLLNGIKVSAISGCESLVLV